MSCDRVTPHDHAAPGDRATPCVCVIAHGCADPFGRAALRDGAALRGCAPLHSRVATCGGGDKRTVTAIMAAASATTATVTTR